MEFTDARFGKLRVVERYGKKWFLAHDVMKSLGVSNPYLLTSKVSPDDKTYVYVNVTTGTPRMIGLTEDGLKTLVYRTHKDGRDEYAAWLRDEVLPKVRGSDVMLPAVRQVDTVPDRVETPTVFHNDEFGDLRTIIIDGKYWFVSKDVALSLGYSNPRKAIIDHVDAEDKMDGVTIRDSMGREQNPTWINESGVYSLIFSSKLPKAKAFKHWVTNDVLPSIRKHGVYVTPQVTQQTTDDPIELLRKAVDLLEVQYKLTGEWRNKNAELVSKLDDTTYDLVVAKDEVRRMREQYYKATDEVETLRNQIEAYRKESSHRKEFTSFINSCVRSFVGASCGQYIMPTGWNEYYRRLTDVLGDDVRKRGRQPYIDAISDEELPIAMRVAAEMGTGDLVARLMSDTIRNAIAA